MLETRINKNQVPELAEIEKARGSFADLGERLGDIDGRAVQAAADASQASSDAAAANSQATAIANEVISARGTFGTLVGRLSDMQINGAGGWKAHVQAASDLPGAGNNDGDTRIVLDENKTYRWDAAGMEWKLLSGGDTGSGQEVIAARGSYATLGERLDNMSNSSGAVTFQETFAALDYVDTNPAQTTATVDTRGVRLSKGTLFTEEFTGNSHVDVAATSPSIVVDLQANEVRTNRTGTSALFQAAALATSGTNLVQLATTEVHEFAFNPGTETNRETTGRQYLGTVTDGQGRTWVFEVSTTINQMCCVVYDKDGAVVKTSQQIATFQDTSQTPVARNIVAHPRAVVLPNGNIAVLVIVQQNSVYYLTGRTLKPDFSDFTSQTVTSVYGGGSTSAPPANAISAAVDPNGRIHAHYYGGYAAYRVFNSDLSVYSTERQLSAPRGTIMQSSMVATTSGHIALLVETTFTPSGRATTINADYYLWLMNPDGSTAQNALTISTDNYLTANGADWAHNPVVLEPTNGKFVIILEDVSGLMTFRVDQATWTVEYRKSTTSASQTVYPFGGWSATNRWGTYGNYAGVKIVPSRDIAFLDIGFQVYNASTSYACSNSIYLYRLDGSVWTRLTYINVSVGANGAQSIFANGNLLYKLEAGKTYFIGLQVVQSGTSYGGCEPYYSATTTTAQTFSWGTVSPVYMNSAMNAVYDIAAGWNTVISVDTGGYQLYNRVSYSGNHLSARYQTGDTAIMVGFRKASGTLWQTYSDYQQPAMLMLDPSSLTVLDQFTLDNNLSQANCWGPFINRTQTGKYFVVYNRGSTVVTQVVQSTPTSIAWQVSVDGGTNWQSITPGGGPAIFGDTYNVARGGTPLGNLDVPANAFDGSNSTYASSPNNTVSGTYWIGYDFGTARALKRFYITQGNGYNSYGIGSVKVQYSSDGNTWTDVQVVNIANPTNGVWYSFTNTVAARFWRLLANANTISGPWQVQEVGFAESTVPSGSSVVLRATLNAARAGYTPHIKGYTLTEWAYGSNGAVTRLFASAKLPAKAPTARATISPTQVLNGGSIRYFLSNDGGQTWSDTVPGQPVVFSNWGGSDVRVKAEIASPDGINLSPVISGYTLVTSDAVAASLVEARMKVREIESLKNRLDIDTLMGASKHKLVVSVSDTFNDAAGIDGSLSSGYTFDSSLKLVKGTSEVCLVSTGNSGNGTGVGNYWDGSGSQNYKRTQSFTASSGILGRVGVGVQSIDGVPGPLQVSLYSNDAGKPGTMIGTPVQITQANIVAGVKNYFDFSSQNIALTDGTKYWLVVETPQAPAATASVNAEYFISYNASNVYAGGDFGWLQGGTAYWSIPTSEDMEFAVYTAGGGTATVVSTADTAAAPPSKIYMTAQELLNTGTITYYVSRDNGTTWLLATKDDVTDVSGAPSGTQVRIKAVITAGAQLLGWGWGWY